MKRMILLISLVVGLPYSGVSQVMTLTNTKIQSNSANTTGLSFGNINSASPASSSNGKVLALDPSGNVILVNDNSGGNSFWTLSNSVLQNPSNTSVSVLNDFTIYNTYSNDEGGQINLANPGSSGAHRWSIDNYNKSFRVIYYEGTPNSVRIPLQINQQSGIVLLQNGLQIGNTTSAIAGTIRWTGSDFEGFTGTEWKSFTQPSPTIPQTFWRTVLEGGNPSCPTGYTNTADPSGYSCRSGSTLGSIISYNSSENRYKCNGNSITAIYCIKFQ